MTVKNIIFDFDGVILDSMEVKTLAFKRLFKDFPEEKVATLLEYHLRNGGMSRYEKIRYFFHSILGKPVDESVILEFAQRYSDLTRCELANPAYLIEEVVSFVRNNFGSYNMHVASGADERDLKYICDRLGLTSFFISIHGSPRSKEEIVRYIINTFGYRVSETILVGDSINDYYAALANGIAFVGYNNESLKDLDRTRYVANFEELYEIIRGEI